MIYAGVERKGENTRLETHTIEILDEPRQIVTLQTRNDVLILLPAEKVDKLWVKLRRGSVEVSELLQIIARGHKNVWLEQQLGLE